MNKHTCESQAEVESGVFVCPHVKLEWVEVEKGEGYFKKVPFEQKVKSPLKLNIHRICEK